jgi:hypothetical protein
MAETVANNSALAGMVNPVSQMLCTKTPATPAHAPVRIR